MLIFNITNEKLITCIWIFFSVPCSVITSHGECSHGENDILQPSTSTVVPPYIDLAQQDLRINPDETGSLGSVTVYEFVSVNMWPQTEQAAATVLQEQAVSIYITKACMFMT